MLDYRYDTFLVLVETKNYTKTAQILNFTQPAVTKHIQYIEKELGVSLVKYQDKTLTITPEGLYLYKKIKNLKSEILQINSHLTNTVSLRIGASKTIGEYWIPQYITEYSNHYPKSSLSLMVDNTKGLLKLIHAHKIDLALISGPIEDKSLAKEIFFKDNIICICSNSHPLAKQEVSLKDLENETVIFREKGSGISDAMMQLLDNQNLSLDYFSHKQYVGNINLIKQMILHNRGISFIYESSINLELMNQSVSQIHLTDIDLHQNFYVVMNQNQPINTSTRFFLDSLKEHKKTPLTI